MADEEMNPPDERVCRSDRLGLLRSAPNIITFAGT